MKEVRTKLTHGLSVTTTEDHLQNAAILLGKEAIPTKCIGVGTCIRLEGPKESSTRSARDFFTTPTFPSNHAHFRINEAV